MNRSLLDTDIFSEIIKGKNPVVVENATRYREQFSRYSLSVITVTTLLSLLFQNLPKPPKLPLVLNQNA